MPPKIRQQYIAQGSFGCTIKMIEAIEDIEALMV